MKANKGPIIFAIFVTICVLLFMAGRSDAHHVAKHRTMYFGTPTEVPIQFPACNVEHNGSNPMVDVLTAHRDEGEAAGGVLYRGYNQILDSEGSRVCGMIVGFVIPVEVLFEADLKFSDGQTHNTKAVRVQFFNPSIGTGEVVGMFINIAVEKEYVPPKPGEVRCEGNCLHVRYLVR